MLSGPFSRKLRARGLQLYRRATRQIPLLPWIVLFLIAIGLLSPLYFRRKITFHRLETPSFFPAGRAEDDDVCAGFPKHLLRDVQVVVKTGVVEEARIKGHLSTVLACIDNVLFFSDVEQIVNGKKIYDALEHVESWPKKDASWAPDFYAEQKERFTNTGEVKYSKTGWKLDKYKFLPMVERTHELRPGRKWYVFLETDTYMFWDTLFRLLHQHDPERPLLLGSRVNGGRCSFPYGGSGYVMSGGLMDQFFAPGRKNRASLSEQYADWVGKDCCGDAVLGYAIQHRTGVVVTDMYPTICGDELAHVEVNAERWCVPLLSLHRTSVQDYTRLWNWERSRPRTNEPFTFSSLLGFSLSHLQDGDLKYDWDNFSHIKRKEETLDDCAAACAASKKCMQYSFYDSQCKFGNTVTMGAPVRKERGMMVSGWDSAKLKALGWTGDREFVHTCPNATWIKV